MIFLVRHGETQWNAESRRQGRGDSVLTQTGIEQSRAVARQLKANLPEGQEITLVTSPAGRSRRTAVIIAEELGMDPNRIRIANQLEEMDFGDWTGLTDEEIAEQQPEQWRARQLNRWFFEYPNGESYPKLCSRVSQWMETAEDIPGVTIAVTHQWTSRVIRGQYLRLPKEDMFPLMHPHHHIVRLHDGEETVITVPENQA